MTRESIEGMFGAAGFHLGPGVDAALMVDAEASQPGDGLPLYQILQTDGALSTVFTKHIRVVR